MTPMVPLEVYMSSCMLCIDLSACSGALHCCASCTPASARMQSPREGLLGILHVAETLLVTVLIHEGPGCCILSARILQRVQGKHGLILLCVQVRLPSAERVSPLLQGLCLL